MAANRQTNSAPYGLTKLSKTTLADLVWALAATAPECASCDDAEDILIVIEARLEHPWVEAPSVDRRTVETILKGVRGIKEGRTA